MRTRDKVKHFLGGAGIGLVLVFASIGLSYVINLFIDHGAEIFCR